MRLPRTAHTRRPWRIHGIVGDFTVEDVWALPTPGGPDDMPELVRQIARSIREGMNGDTAPTRLLFTVRRRIGGLLGWDARATGIGARTASLRGRLPADLRDGPRGPDLGPSPFTSLYETGDEWAAEMANKTVHAVLHLGWVGDGSGGHRGQLAVLVKPNGPLGRLYMLAIRPFRHLWVYPALTRSIGRTWRAGTAGRAGR
ncbi:DUF2867 domain-containing protein [Streptomyces sp. NPDC048507]|uniref:DUF2867 domain-containing protein n=1 Tax=Streptomyces sp. NPDC048507 TaxID=3365560 RepID=UPI003713862D